MTTLLCGFCEEPMDEKAAAAWAMDAPPVRGTQPLHRECAIRLLVGSVGHLTKRCGCYVDGPGEDDPPHLTKRQAAREAVRLHGLLQLRN